MTSHTERRLPGTLRNLPRHSLVYLRALPSRVSSAYSIADLILTACALLLAAAFLQVPWTTGEETTTAYRALHEAIPPTGAMPEILLNLIPVAAVIGGLGGLWGLLDTRVRRISASMGVVAAAVGLAYFGAHFLIAPPADMQPLAPGIGFWVGLACCAGMIVQFIVPQTAILRIPGDGAAAPPIDEESALLRGREQLGFTAYARQWAQRIRSGDLGQLPVMLGLIVICILFQLANPIFLTPFNLVNLLVQASIVITIAYGVVLVLLLGEIDLSMGYTAGISAVIIALLVRAPIVIPGVTTGDGIQVSWYVAVALGVGAATLVGFIQGFFVTAFKLPSFIVTLAGQLALSGLVLLTVKGLGTLSMRDPVVLGSVRAFLPLETGWLFAIVVAIGFYLSQAASFRARRASGLGSTPSGIIMLQTAGVGLAVAALVYIANLSGRGLPFSFVLLLLMLVVLTYITTSTKFGRYLFAVGGNKEAARRAGIDVERIRVMGFMLGSFMAGLGGVFLVARLGSVAPDTGSGPMLLNAIAAAVIGGTSLFGGSGKISSALLGGLVIASVDNGLGLIPGMPSDAKFILTAGILLLAVIVDSFTRRNAARSGR